MAPKETVYEPLLDRDGLETDSQQSIEPRFQPSSRRFFTRRASFPLWMIVSVAFMQVVTVTLLLRGTIKRSCDYANPQLLYSPAENMIQYEVKKFRSGLNGEGDDIYSLPPSDEVDAAWADLYNFGVTELTEDQANRLANVTMEVPNSDNKYVMLLDVFHELHCINLLRKALYPQHYYNSTDTMSESKRKIHLTHCLGSLRQSVMCSSDISTIVWRKPEGEREGPRFDIIHSCRNFDQIKQWALDNRGSIFVKEGHLSATSDGFKDVEMDHDHQMGHHHHEH